MATSVLLSAFDDGGDAPCPLLTGVPVVPGAVVADAPGLLVVVVGVLRLEVAVGVVPGTPGVDCTLPLPLTITGCVLAMGPSVGSVPQR